MASKFLKAFKSAFFVEVEEPNKKEEVVTPPVSQSSQSVVQPVQVQTPIITNPIQNGVITGQLDNDMLENLCTVLDEKNLPGPDYLELKNAANAEQLKQILADENARMVCAYSSMKANSKDLTKQRVLDSIDKYIQYIEEERTAGMEQLAQKRKVEVEDKQNELERVQQEMVELQEEINKRAIFVAETSAAIATAANECEVKKANFNTTVDFIVSGLVNDKNKLSQILTD